MTDSTSSLATPYLNIEYMSYFAAIALSCYDYGLTLEREIRLVWRRGFSTSSILYYAVRYSAVLGTLSCIVDLAYHNNLLMRSCGVVLHIDMSFDIIILISAAVFSALRVFALWDRNPWIFSSVLILGMVNPAISIYTFTQTQPFMYSIPTGSCGFDNSVIPENEYEKWLVGARISSVLADVLVLIVTWTRTWPVRAEAVRTNFTAHLTDTLMKDGALYFIVLLVTNVIGLILSRKIELVQPVTAFIGLLTSIFMSHFILDLHEAANVHAHENATMQVSGLSTVTSIVFHNYPDGPPRGQTRSRSTSCSVYGARLTHISASDDWDEPQDNVEDTTMAGSPAKEPRFS